ncbi:MAG: hypothetical protein Q6L58_10465 [Thermostichales cyanobacterium BF3_bins_165]
MAAPLALMSEEEAAEHPQMAAITLGVGTVAGMIVGGATLAYLEGQRQAQEKAALAEHLQELESSLQEKNEKLVELALQAVPQSKDPKEQVQHLLEWTAAAPPQPAPLPSSDSPATPAEVSPPLVTETPAAHPALPIQSLLKDTENLGDPDLPPPGLLDLVTLPVAQDEALSPPPPEVSEVSSDLALPDPRSLQVQLMLQQAKMDELEAELRRYRQDYQDLEQRLASSLAREKTLQQQLEAQSERLMTLEAYQAQVQQQQQQLRQLHAELHKMKQQVAEKNKMVSQMQALQLELDNAKAALQGYHALVKQNQQLQAELHTLKASLPTPAQMQQIYQLVQRQRQRIQELERTIATLQNQQRPPLDFPNPKPEERGSPDYPKWRELLDEAERYSLL